MRSAGAPLGRDPFTAAQPGPRAPEDHLLAPTRPEERLPQLHALAVITAQEQTLPGWEEREDHQVGDAPGICLLEPRRRRKLLPGTGSFTVATAARSYPTAEARLSSGRIVKGSASPYRQGLRTHGECFLGSLLPWRRRVPELPANSEHSCFSDHSITHVGKWLNF